MYPKVITIKASTPPARTSPHTALLIEKKNVLFIIIFFLNLMRKILYILGIAVIVLTHIKRLTYVFLGFILHVVKIKPKNPLPTKNSFLNTVYVAQNGGVKKNKKSQKYNLFSKKPCST